MAQYQQAHRGEIQASDSAEIHARGFPSSAGVWLGLGLGGFVDGIILHQVLQWHHLVSSAGFPPNTLENLQINTFWDGIFHMLTWVFVAIGLILLWRGTRKPHAPWSGKHFFGTILFGFGLFNTVEGIVDHHLLGLHHVNESVPPEQWIYWDIAFTLSGIVMLIAGWLLWQAGQRESEELVALAHDV